MKKPAAIALAIGATLAGAGVALAQGGVGDPPPVEAPPADPQEDTPVGPPEEVPPVSVEVPEAAPVEQETTEPETGTDAADNHGAAVSQAAHDCPRGPGGVHGACVSAVARDHDGDGVPDHGPGSPGHGQDDVDDEADDDADDDAEDEAEDEVEADDEVDDEADDEVEGDDEGGGNGHGNGNGNGHGRD